MPKKGKVLEVGEFTGKIEDEEGVVYEYNVIMDGPLPVGTKISFIPTDIYLMFAHIPPVFRQAN